MSGEEANELIKRLTLENNIYKELTRQAQDDVKIWRDLYKKEKEKNKRLIQCHFKYEEMTGVDLLLSDKVDFIEKE